MWNIPLFRFLQLYLLLYATNSIFYIVSYHEIGNWLHNLQAAPPIQKKTKIKKSLFLLGNQLVNNLTLELQLTEESRNVWTIYWGWCPIWWILPMHGKGWHMGWTYGTAGSFSCDTGICAFTGWDHFLPCLQLLSALIHLVLTIGLVLVFLLLFFFLISNALLCT